MKSCVIYSNCQADGLATFLPMMGFPYEITVYRNYQLILKEQSPDDLRRDAARADLFIYQPTDERHEEFSSDAILKLLPLHCVAVSFAYVYNHAFFPLTEHGGKFIGSEFMNPLYWDLPKETLLSFYDRGEIDFALWPRFLHCLAEQAKREESCDIKTTEWMLENAYGHIRILLNVNHPSSIMFLGIARKIMKFLQIPITHICNSAFSENHTGLPCSIPHSKYITDFFNTRVREPDDEAHEFYRHLLAKAWESKQT